MSGVGELMLVVMILRMGEKNVTCGASERRRPVLVAPHIFKDTFIFPLFFLLIPILIQGEYYHHLFLTSRSWTVDVQNSSVGRLLHTLGKILLKI